MCSIQKELWERDDNIDESCCPRHWFIHKYEMTNYLLAKLMNTNTSLKSQLLSLLKTFVKLLFKMWNQFFFLSLFQHSSSEEQWIVSSMNNASLSKLDENTLDNIQYTQTRRSTIPIQHNVWSKKNLILLKCYKNFKAT